MFMKHLAGHWLVVVTLFGLYGFLSLAQGAHDALPNPVAAAPPAVVEQTTEVCLLSDDIEAVDWEERHELTLSTIC